MTLAMITRPAWLVVFDGQSHNNVPAGPLVADVPVRDALALATNPGMPAYAMYGRGVPWRNAAISNTSWTTLAATRATRCFQWANSGDETVLVMNGGTSDIDSGDSGATVYADEVEYANAARAAGFDYVVGCTIPPSSSFSAGENTARTNHNGLLLADASNAFDGVADLASQPELDDNLDTAYYFDGVHWWHTGAYAAARCLSAVLEAIPGFPGLYDV